MRELNAADFARFFEEMWRKPPFDWQRRLAARVLEQAGTSKAWPEAIALAAASGKTACIDIAVFALAAQSSRLADGGAITAPRRIFFVVDRRVIVDQAYERACEIRKRLQDASSGILKEIADRLRHIARGEIAGFADEPPLEVYSLRGGMYRSDAWARTPLQPMIVASTVDQIGSRLLFRAYGRGSNTWPIYAGLVANDSLILLDEAHCAQPFLQTLQAVGRFRTWAHAPLERPFYPVVMSATPPPGLDTFTDTSEEIHDLDHPLGRRQLAHKPAILKTVDAANREDIAARLVDAMCEAAWDLIDGGLHAVVVFANRVATARYTYRRLKACPNIKAELLTGRMRPVDKEAVIKRLKDLCLHSGESSKRNLDRPVIVVATQTLEVGADLDFDGLVTECASLDALRQRFGRLNRMGRKVDCRATILIRADQANPKKGNEEDPVYGTSLAKTWKWLDMSKDRNGEVDFGIAYLDHTLPQDHMSLNAPSLDAPVMLPAHIDCWGQTEPVPEPDPDVSLFLHGPERTAPEVRVCWRAGLDLIDKKKEALEMLRFCPPSSSETLPVPLGVFKRWLAGGIKADDSADVEGVGCDTESMKTPFGYNVVRWERMMKRTEDHITSDPKKIQPWDVIVIPTSTTGEFDQLGDLPPDANGAALDIGDRAYRLAQAKPILRLQTELVNAWSCSTAVKDSALNLLKNVEQKHEEDSLANTLHDLLVKLAKPSEPFIEGMDSLQDIACELLNEYGVPEAIRNAYHIVGNSLFIKGSRRLQHLTQEGEAFNDEDDASSVGISHCSGHPVRLRSHLEGVSEMARRYASGCGLPDQLVEAVACAGSLHDIGKADPRFQSMLLGDKRSGNKYYAKSAKYPKTRDARKAARIEAGYPEGRPHPMLSVRLAESAPGLLPDDEEIRDLALHLIGSHHGHCRPFAPIIHDEQSVHVEFMLDGHLMEWTGSTGLERLDSGAADRYWSLVRRYGWWGLAWLESFVRLADWRRSEWEETHD